MSTTPQNQSIVSTFAGNSGPITLAPDTPLKCCSVPETAFHQRSAMECLRVIKVTLQIPHVDVDTDALAYWHKTRISRTLQDSSFRIGTHLVLWCAQCSCLFHVQLRPRRCLFFQKPARGRGQVCHRETHGFGQGFPVGN